MNTSLATLIAHVLASFLIGTLTTAHLYTLLYPLTDSFPLCIASLYAAYSLLFLADSCPLITAILHNALGAFALST